MEDVATWLKTLGLERYAACFAENDINLAILSDLSDQDLKEIGVSSLGHRRQLLRAIAERNLTAKSASHTVAAPVAMLHEQGPTIDAAERRQLTVMFCDLVGSTALSAQLDPEDLRGIIATYHRCCTEVIERNGGFVAKYMGDGVLAYFGYPQAHEHDAERAVRVGLSLVEAVPKLATNAGSPLQVRIGIATGLVVVGDLIGAGAAQEQAVVGETPNLAARLQTLAEPSRVVIASSTRRLTGGLFEYRDLGAVALKGFADHVQTWQVLAASAAESRFEALRATTTPLLGRDEEIEIVMRRWAHAKRGDGAVVLISGEPGIGKSRIAQTIVERLSAEPHTRLRYFCSPHHQDSALYPSITQLERAAGFRREDTDEQRLAKLEAVLAQGTNDLSEAVPLLADLLSIPIGDRSPLNFAPQKRREKTLHAQLMQVEGLAARQPVLIVWEDVHWSDPTTRESLDLLIDRVPTLRVLIIITFRPEFAPPWIGRRHVTMLTLNRLAPWQRAEMIGHLTGGKELPKEIADQIVDRTDGVPLFIEELTKAVVESGIVTNAGDHYSVTGPVASRAIPTTLHASLLARLDRLAPMREVAQIAATLGRSFSHELISAVAQMPRQKLDEALEQLESAELIFRRGTPPDAEYTFKHALVQDVAYSTLLRSRRQQLHSRIAATLESRFPEIVRARPTLLAQHCTEAGLIEKAIGYWLAAGQQANARSMSVEAASMLSRGLALIPALHDDVSRLHQELHLQIALGRALMVNQGYTAPAVGQTHDRARQLCEQLNRPPELWRVLYGQYSYHIMRGETQPAQQLAEELQRLGEIGGNVAARVTGFRASGATYMWLAELTAARVCLEQSLTLYDPVQQPLYAELHIDTLSTILSYLGATLAYLGHLDQASSRTATALTEARRHPYAPTLAQALSLAYLVGHAVRSAPALLLRYADEALALSAEREFPFFHTLALAQRDWCLAALGHHEDGIPLIANALGTSRDSAAMGPIPKFLTHLGDAYGMAGQPRAGLRYLAEAEQLAEATKVRLDLAETLWLRGDLLSKAGEPAAAEQCYHQALTVARRQKAKLLELRAGISLGRLLRDQGKRIEAHDLLTAIYGWFTEGFDTPVLKEAKALVDELR
jgi:class 3 adenylate cyclase/tetratricopeptide (TPR) repeat protein